MRFYRLLLRLYPNAFRRSYGPELLRTFEEESRDRGSLASVVAAITDVVPNALTMHGEILAQDLRYAIRGLRRAPSFAVTVILVTAIGVGANTATFSVADHVLLRPLAYPQPDELVRLCEGPREGGGWGCNNQISPLNFRDVQTRAASFAALGAFQRSAVNLLGVGDPVRVSSANVSGEVMPLLGVGAQVGRVLDASDAADPAVLVLSHALWREQFGGAPDVVGTAVRLDGVPHVIVGVMPPSFRFPTADARLWRPLVVTDSQSMNRTNTILEGIGRLKRDVPFEQAATEMRAIATDLAREYPETNDETGFSFFRQRDEMSPRFEMMLLALGGASFCLLLLTMANLASLHLTRLAAREKELAVRAALGAGRERLVRQMLTESLLLASIGGLVGVGVAAVTVPLLAHLVPTTLPLDVKATLDLRVLFAAAVVTTVVGVGVGLVPAMRAGRRRLFEVLRSGVGGGGARQRLRRVLVGVEIAVSVALLATSGFLIRAAWRVQRVDPGFSTDGALAVRVAIPETRYASSEAKVRFYQAVLSEVSLLPDVEAAGFTSGIPMVMTGGITGISMPGQDAREARDNRASWRIITPDYLRALGVTLVRGRDVEWTDDTTRALVAVVSESFAERNWPGEEPLGRTFVMRGNARTVVGVARDIRVRGLERSSEPQMYLPAGQIPPGAGEFYGPRDLVIRTRRAPLALAPVVRAIVSRVDSDQPISDVRTLDELIVAQNATRVAQVRVLIALAAVALLLTAVGVHGLLAYGVAQRSREIGLRLALGAEPRQVASLVVGEAVRLALLGGVPGVLVAFAAVRSMRALLFGVEPADPRMLIGAALVVVVIAVAGSLAPAARAVRISPMEAMRSE